MDSSSGGKKQVFHRGAFLYRARALPVQTFALTPSYTKKYQKSSVLENFVLVESVRIKIELRVSVSVNKYIHKIGFSGC